MAICSRISNSMQYIQVLDSSSRTHMPPHNGKIKFYLASVDNNWRLDKLPLYTSMCARARAHSLAHLFVYTLQIDVYSHLRINSIRLCPSCSPDDVSTCVCFHLLWPIFNPKKKFYIDFRTLSLYFTSDPFSHFLQNENKKCMDTHGQPMLTDKYVNRFGQLFSGSIGFWIIFLCVSVCEGKIWVREKWSKSREFYVRKSILSLAILNEIEPVSRPTDNLRVTPIR